MIMTNNAASVIFAGDYHVYGEYDSYIKRNIDHNVFSDELVELISKCDLSVFNLEDPITLSKDGCIKSGPYGVGSEASLLPIGKAGFKLATFATNHTYDMKNQGIADTIESCHKYNIDVAGAGLDLKQSRKPYYITLNGYKISILNFARIEFNIATEEHGGANPLDTIDNANDIKNAKAISDYVFVVVHEGADMYSLPYPKLVKQMRFYVDMGADAIITHHSRVISGYEVYNGAPIFYGIGNLLHLSHNVKEHRGIIVKLLIDEKGVRFEIIPIMLKLSEILIDLYKGGEKESIIREISELSLIIADDKKLAEEWGKHVSSSKILYLMILAGYPRFICRIARKLNLTTWLDCYLWTRRRKYLAMKNIFTCQAHREIVNHVLDELFMEK